MPCFQSHSIPLTSISSGMSPPPPPFRLPSNIPTSEGNGEESERRRLLAIIDAALAILEEDIFDDNGTEESQRHAKSLDFAK
ncbi:unnamed protein product [Cylindrotheca closterium]|uniref:Uncharacterized protein n=1 Tax=Cylindrotheca closterium TaxID=2856 RepID=A0AAD2FVB0_9STRA|nr:unnamed protein product [Cylindrotheca closterium]